MPDSTQLLNLIFLALLIAIIYTLRRILLLERRISGLEEGIIRIEQTILKRVKKK